MVDAINFDDRQLVTFDGEVESWPARDGHQA